jgi:hypothetical protein
LPDVWHSKLVLADFLSDGDKQAAVQRNVIELLDVLVWQLERRLSEEYMNAADKEKICRKMLALLELIFEDGDYLQFHELASDTYRKLAELAASDARVSDALALLERAADHCIAADTLPERAEYTSVLLRGLYFNRTEHNRLNPETHSYWLREMLLRNREYDPIRDEPRLSAVIERLEPFAQ